jgi:hypothetical protein
MNHLAKGCSLIDSEARHRAYPETWDHPTAEQLNRIVPGWLVKIGVEVEDEYCWQQVRAEAGAAGIEHTPRGERFWCRVQRITASGIEVKVEQYDMLFSDLHGVHDGGTLTIESRHILDIEAEEPEEEDDDPQGCAAGAMKDPAAIFGYLRSNHHHLHEQLRESKRRDDLYNNCAISSQMILLRDIGRFILGFDPEDDTNPFGGPEDY